MKKSTRWAWAIASVATTGAALVLAFVLSLSTQGGGTFERHFVWLFWVNVAVAALLVLVIGLAVGRLAIRLRRGKFGSRLLLKLAGIFALVGLLPGLLVYTVSYQFVTRSIEAWLDVRVAGALDAGLALGRNTLETLVTDIGERTRLAADRLGESDSALRPLTLERLREQFGARDVSVLSAAGQVLATAGGSAMSILPDRPDAALLRQVQGSGLASRIEGLDDEATTAGEGRGPHVRVLATLSTSAMALSNRDARFLMVTVPVPRSIATNALAVQAAYSEYQQRALAHDGLRRMYIGTLTLALVLAVFGSLLLAVLLGNQLAKPLLLLADGVRQVAGGDLRPKPVFMSRDELGGLTRSFADMTQQLADARAEVQRGVAELEAARTHLQTILDNLSAGVIVFDAQGQIDTVNPGATRILRLPVSAWRGQRLQDRPELPEFARAVAQRNEALTSAVEAGERDHWQDAFELRPGDPNSQTLLARGAALPYGARLLVFDDITEVVSAQRSQAWAEVARRLAHEIKNPLTPIQLSAERLQHKLEAKLEGADRALLQRSVATIVNQVQAMQQLVNEFREYARLPAAKLVPLALGPLVHEVLALYGEALDQGRLSAQIDDALPEVLGDVTQLRQVIHNLVQNALDAVADREDGRVQVQAGATRGDDGMPKSVRLAVVDNGPGFAEQVLKRAFEPYVTTKAKGTGLGLAVVKKIADEHGARLRVGNLHFGDDEGAAVTGARVSLSFSRFAPLAGETGGGPAPGDRPIHAGA